MPLPIFLLSLPEEHWEYDWYAEVPQINWCASLNLTRFHVYAWGMLHHGSHVQKPWYAEMLSMRACCWATCGCVYQLWVRPDRPLLMLTYATYPDDPCWDENDYED